MRRFVAALERHYPRRPRRRRQQTHMPAFRIAVLLGIVCSSFVTCRPPTAPTTAQAGASAIAWQTLPEESDPSLGAPPSLEADGGRTVRLRSVEVRAQVALPAASTELELVFDEIPGRARRFRSICRRARRCTDLPCTIT